MNFLRVLLGFAMMLASLRSAETGDARPSQHSFCIADDWSWPHAGAYGDKVVCTPNFDRVAREGTLFNNALCAAPSCTPSRAAILAGRLPHQLDEGGNFWDCCRAASRLIPTPWNAPAVSSAFFGDAKRMPALLHFEIIFFPAIQFSHLAFAGGCA